MHSFDEATIIFLGIGRLRGVGFKTLRDLGGVDAIAERFVASPREFTETVTRESQPTDIKQHVYQAGEEAMKKMAERKICMSRRGDAYYPSKFENLEENLRPLWFFYRGDITLLKLESIAVVGTRSPSQTGEFLTRYAVSAVRELEIPVVSGLAKGIDEIAHEWALTSNLPTISVLGNGLLRTYPQKNAELANKIVDSGGLLLSEYMPSAEPSAENFVWRNRLQAALARCVVAPEWKKSSGTAHTIRFAKRMGRLTINLRITNGRLVDEHGEADLLFEVPVKHSDFVEAMRERCIGIQKEITETEATVQQLRPTQRDLFGESGES